MKHWITKVSVGQKVYEIEIWRIFQFFEFNFCILKVRKHNEPQNDKCEHDGQLRS
jgi:hypothetical protein